MNIVIDPKMFINEPFIKCPKCNKVEFGVLMINKRSYVRRCRGCWHDQSFPLPEIKKKIIYLDQFAISNMMKALNPKTKANQSGKLDPFFKTLFEKLDRLNKLQLIICPDSNNHFNESIVSPYYKALKRLYEQLSHGTTFYDTDTVIRFQITQNFKEWLGERGVKDFDAEQIVHGETSEWQSRFIISVSLRDQDPQLADQIRAERDQVSDYLNSVFARWQKDSRKNFNDWYNEEKDSFGRMILNKYLRDLATIASANSVPETFNQLFSLSAVTISTLMRKLQEKGYSDEESLKKIVEYFNSEEIKEVQFVNVSAMLYASLARSAAGGRKKPPTKGMVNDVEVISAYVPYCDAMFVDNECHTFLTQEPLKSKLRLENKVFSLNTKNDFLAYLDNIEKNASDKHLKLVADVYGEKWATPYLTMFEYPSEED